MAASQAHRRPLLLLMLWAAFALLLCVFSVLNLTPSENPLRAQAAEKAAEEAAEDEDEGDELETESLNATILPLIEDTVLMPDGADDLLPKLTRIERDITAGVDADVRGNAAERDQAFAKAQRQLRAIHQEYLIEYEFDPMVRARNFLPLGRQDTRMVETWRPLSDYLCRWVALLPAKLQQDFGRDLEINAARALASLDERRTLSLAKQASAYYLFAKSGEAINDMAMRLAFNDGSYLDAAYLALRFKECRPITYRTLPERQLYLMLALSALGEEEMLAEEVSYATEHFAQEKFMVGDAEMSFDDAHKALISTLHLSEENEAWLPTFTNMATPTRLSASSGWGENPNHAFATEPLIFDRGVVLPRALYRSGDNNRYGRRQPDVIVPPDSELHWYENYQPDQSRWLEFARPEAAHYPAPRNWRNASGFVGFRTYGAAYASFQGRQTSFSAASQQSMIVASLASGAFNESPLSGSRLQVFDLNSEGRTLAVLPISKDLPRIGREGETIGDDWQILLSSMHFGSTPICVGDRVYVMGAVTVGASIEVHAVCFSLSASVAKPLGSVVWTRKLCALSNPSSRNNWGGSSMSVETSRLTYRLGKLYAVTNSGSIFAINAEDGAPEWVAKYETVNKTPTWSWRANLVEDRNSLVPSAPVLDGVTLIGAATDAGAAFSLSALSGDLIRSIKGEDDVPFATFRYFLGARDGLAYFQSPSAIYAAPVSFRSQALNAEGALVAVEGFSSRDLMNFDQLEIATRHRATLFGDELLLHGDSHVMRVDRLKFGIREKHKWPRWGEELKHEDGKPMVSQVYYSHENDILNLSVIPAKFSPNGRPMLMRSANRGALVYPLGSKSDE